MIELAEQGCPPDLAVRILARSSLLDERAGVYSSDHVGADPSITRTGAGAAADRSGLPPNGSRASAARARSRDEAIERLHALLLRGARFEVGRRQASLPHLRGGELDDIALEAADDALMSVLRRLDDFRGLSRFTTWAYKFALLRGSCKAAAARLAGARGADGGGRLGPRRERGLQPDKATEQAELLAAIKHAIELALSPHQRPLLVALAVNGAPIDASPSVSAPRAAPGQDLARRRRKPRRQLAGRRTSRGT